MLARPIYLHFMTIVTITPTDAPGAETVFVLPDEREFVAPFARTNKDGDRRSFYCDIRCAVAEPDEILQPLPVEPVYAADAHDRYCGTCGNRVA